MATCAGVDFNLTDNEVALIASVVFAGEVVGSIFWGPFADRYGRRISFLMESCIITLFGLLSATSPSFGVLLAFRFLVGFGVGGLFVPFDILAEFLPTKHRGQFLIKMNFFWSCGAIFGEFFSVYMFIMFIYC